MASPRKEIFWVGQSTLHICWGNKSQTAAILALRKLLVSAEHKWCKPAESSFSLFVCL
jgi:hypothetical protein